MNEDAKSPLRKFEPFVRMVFRHENDGRELGDEPYIPFICAGVEKAREEGARSVINMPPRHLKTSICTVSLSAWLLGLNPSEKIQIFTYSSQLAVDIGYRIRAVLQSTWFKRHFQTRLTSDRASVTDFATTAGGGVYAASASGSFIGRGATLIIFDDPLDMDDAGNLEKRERINQRFDSAIMSRLNDPKSGRVVINGHRLHEDDLSGHVLAMGGWDHLALPFEAPRDQVYSFGGRSLHRKKGELLRPNAFSQAEVNRIKSIINPDYEALYQQFLGEGHSIRISRDQFGSFTYAPKDAPIVISVDPGHRGGPGHSFTVMQAWLPFGNEFLLLDQWREQADVGEACSALKFAAKNCRPAAVLIEYSGYGQTIARDLQKQFRSLQVDLVPPDRCSKTARLLRHIEVIQNGRVKLFERAAWREAWVSEFEQFPHDAFDDQVDAFTLAMDYLVQGPTLIKPQGRALGGTLSTRGVFTTGTEWGRRGIRGYTALGRQRRPTRIFPKWRKQY
jgi:predicted phage terminase large subunit-like protein